MYFNLFLHSHNFIQYFTLSCFYSAIFFNLSFSAPSHIFSISSLSSVIYFNLFLLPSHPHSLFYPFSCFYSHIFLYSLSVPFLSLLVCCPYLLPFLIFLKSHPLSVSSFLTNPFIILSFSRVSTFVFLSSPYLSLSPLLSPPFPLTALIRT